ncbi:MAG: hypothetical protein ACREQ2_22810 [Candidatus Binatia bacterium]
MKITNLGYPRAMGLGAAMLLFTATATMAQPIPKIPSEVIDLAAAEGTVLVLVGLKVPWQMESNLSADQVNAQREAIASIQKNLLSELEGKSYKITRRYDRIPGIALEVGADALAELAHSPNVTNVLLDRPAATADEAPSSDKVPSQLFTSAAANGTVLVLAGLRTPWQREDQLSEELVALQRSAILSAQSYILAELGGTQFRVLRLYRSIPGIALRVGVDALRVLQNSPAVTNVVPDRPARIVR